MKIGSTLFWAALLINGLCAPLYALMLLNALAFQVPREIWISALFLVGLVAALFLRVLQRELFAGLILAAISL